MDYQILVNGQPVCGNDTLTKDGLSTVSEKVTTTSGGPIGGGGIWCLSTAPCKSYGSLPASQRCAVTVTSMRAVPTSLATPTVVRAGSGSLKYVV